jgi:hypothetical protein
MKTYSLFEFVMAGKNAKVYKVKKVTSENVKM